MRAPKARVFQKFNLKEKEKIFVKNIRVFNAKKTLKNSSRRSTLGAASFHAPEA